jgi:DNA relaxase NicK
MTSITGRGCDWIDDWDRAQEAVAVLPAMQLRRVDLALDTTDGSVTHERVVEAHREGLFTTRGRPPGMKRIEFEGPGRGRMVCVGNREEAKYFRGYEKGRELVKGFPAHVEPTHIDGVPIDDLYRCEVEYKPKHGPLPVDLIDKRDQYFAGSYPFLEHLLDVEPEVFVQRRDRGPQLDLAAMLAQVRHQYGSSLFTALAAYHGDYMAVWERIVGHRHNVALLDAGVLLVDHDS